jgi:hypothetical protein
MVTIILWDEYFKCFVFVDPVLLPWALRFLPSHAEQLLLSEPGSGFILVRNGECVWRDPDLSMQREVWV